MDVQVFPDRAAAGRAAGAAAAAALRATLARQDTARVVFAAAPSQLATLAALRAAPGIDWSRVIAFHMDEYIGLAPDAPERFGRFLREQVGDLLRPRELHLISPGDDPEAECARYAELLAAAPIDLVCLGIGDNGHLAFNDPPVADFADPHPVKVVALDDACRRQQVGDGCFARLDDVPEHAVTLTVPALLAGRRLIATVPGAAKHDALHAALEGPVTTACPASALRGHPAAELYADLAAYGPCPQPQTAHR
ncbi:6-phosphogluconolactonase [Streptomyces boninensis]|uniref:6-phosphogluconolactonase n=1 Tax=Streptomyces boninensis TaxID=2039455 RepID=UPI003B21B599